MAWHVLLPLVFIVNVIAAIAIAELLKRIDTFAWKILEIIRKKTSIITSK
jgi:hypothetical protein